MHSNNTFVKPVLVLLIAAAALLTGCATVSTVESEVNSFSAITTPVPTGAFRFERLPSQDQDAKQAELLEGMAQAALEKAGFSRNDAAARYSVQVSAETTESVLLYPDPFFGRPLWSPFRRPTLWHGRHHMGSLWLDRDVYVSRVRLEIRDVATGKVVYESTASNEQSWFNASKVLPALFTAAMADFPSPPKGTRKVVVKLPGAS